MSQPKKLSKRLKKKLAYLILAGASNSEAESTRLTLLHIFRISVSDDEASEITGYVLDELERYSQKSQGWQKALETDKS